MRKRLLAGILAAAVSFTSINLPVLAMETGTRYRTGTQLVTQNTTEKITDTANDGFGSFYSNANISLAEETILDLSGQGNQVTVQDFSGGGTLILGQQQTLTITGEVTGNTKVAIGQVDHNGNGGMPTEGVEYIKADSAQLSSFTLATPAANPYMTLVYSNGAFVLGTESRTETDKVKDITVADGKSNIEVETGSATTYNGLEVTWAEDAVVADLGMIPLTVSYNDLSQSLESVSGNDGYYTYKVEIEGETYELEVVNQTIYIHKEGSVAEGLPVGQHSFTMTVPGSHTADGQEITVSFTIKAVEKQPEDATLVPTITAEPTGAEYTVGDSAAPLKVTVSGNGTLTYQWYKNTRNSNNGGSSIADATSAEYTPPTDSHGTMYYYCKITNTKDGTSASVTSKAVEVKVKEAPLTAAETPSITTQPTDATYVAGTTNTAFLKVEASVGDGGHLTYQWYKNTTDSNQNGQRLPGQTREQYQPPATVESTTYYYCVVTNTRENTVSTVTASTASDAAAIIVTPKSQGGSGSSSDNEPGDGTVTRAESPTITTEPQDAEYGLNETAAPLTFSASVNDGGTLTYQWYKGSTSYTLRGTEIEGATEPSYTPDTSEAGTVYYYCKITNTNNEATPKTAEVYTRPAQIRVVQAEGSGTVSMNDWVYGETPSLPTVTSETNDPSKVVYSYSGTTNAGVTYGPSNRIPTEAGTYEIQATIAAVRDYKEVVVTDEFTILRAPGAGSVTIDDWTYEEAPKLPKPTSAKNGTGNVTYSYSGTTNAGVAYGPSTVAPRDAGNYTVQATFGMAPNYEEATATDSFVIHKAKGRASVSIEDWDYGSPSSNPVPQSDTNGTDGVTYLYTGTTVTGETYGPTDVVPVLAGNYNVQAFFPGNYNYEPTTATVDFTINRCAISVSSADIPSKVYDGNISASYNSITFADKNGQGVPLTKDDYIIESVVYNDPNAGTDKIVTITAKLKNPNYVFERGKDKLKVYNQVIEKSQGSITYRANVSKDNEVLNKIILTEVLKSISGYRGESTGLSYSASYGGGKFTELRVSGNDLTFRTIKDVEYEAGIPEIITVTVEGLNNYHKVVIRINAFISPENIWVDNFTKEYTYTGNKITQSIQVYDGDTLLKEKVDYTLIYKNNVNAYEYGEKDTEYFNPKKAPQVIIKMKGNYKDSQTLYFKIMRADISGQGSTADDVYATYNGKKQTPMPNVIWNGRKLKNNKDFYVLQYDEAKDNKSAFVGKPSGTTTERLSIIGTGNFKGTKYINHVIGKNDDTIRDVVISKASIKGVKTLPWSKAAKYGEGIAQGKLTIKYKGKELKPSLDYTISYENNRAVGTASVIIRGTGYDYDADGIAFIGLKRINFKITGVNVAKVKVDNLVKSGYAYTGKLINPAELSAQDNGGKAMELSYKKDKKTVTLVKGVEYTVTCINNLDKGVATMIIDGNESEGFTGTRKVNFKIVPDNLAKKEGAIYSITPSHEDLITVSGNDGYSYTMPFMKGGAKPKAVVMAADGTVLEEGKDYTISYKNNKTVADASKVELRKAPAMIVKGKGNYAGSVTVNFSIEKKDNWKYDEVTVVAKDKVESTKPNGWKQKVKVVDEDGKALTPKDYDSKNLKYIVKSVPGGSSSLVGTDLTQSASTQVPAGTIIEVQATLSGNSYTGVAKGTYKIIPKGHDLSKANIKINPQPYTGEEILITDKAQFKKTSIKIGKSSVDLEFGKDFEIVEGSYRKNIKKGTARVTIKAKDGSAYGGQKTVTFKITQRSIITNWDGIIEYIMQML